MVATKMSSFQVASNLMHFQLYKHNSVRHKMQTLFLKLCLTFKMGHNACFYSIFALTDILNILQKVLNLQIVYIH